MLKIDIGLIKDALDIFDVTLNVSAKNSLQSIFKTKLSSNEAIQERQQILKCFRINYVLFKQYHYPLIHQREVFLNLEQNKFTNILSFENPLKKLNSNKQLAQDLKGKAIQFIHFFDFYYQTYLRSFDSSQFPDLYKSKYQQFVSYLNSFNLEEQKKRIIDKKFHLKETLEVVKIMETHYKNKQQQIFIDFFFEFEAFIAITNQSILYNFCFAETSESQVFIDNFYHPKLTKPVKNTLVNSNGVLLLTGANMAGKSTLLKSIGLCVYLHHLGLPIPATKAQIPFYNHIYIFLNNNDDLNSGYSYFMQEILNLKEVVVRCSNNETCFAIFDELFKGTNFEDAFAISQTTLNGLVKFNTSLFIISSHIHQLKQVVEKQQTIQPYYLECLIKDNHPQFTYELKKGFSDLKLGQILFNSEKLNTLFG
ncbi:hypothetical protein H1R17_07885 [Flavobacterium sp. xlx-214]|uniref:MutS-related protein n=1 Tax=unclassified Flavobacterium TaxID=196869 RepID=UPI0013D46558|nr:MULTISPECIES: hypothetical protein [unclassified Flavobacterium]MBA5792265.1 hypothetical protein [Flavobacterium sp. xlx-221]QMI82418.1 hypothetical protein H1R17_07885 [Flavobacterium sp. xlx-214]